MRAMMLAFLVTVTSAAVVLPAGAGAPAGTFEEAGRLVDQLAARLGSFGAELAQQIQPGRGGIGLDGRPMGRMTAEPAERPLITIMLHHRTELGLSPDQVARLETLRADFAREAIRRGRRHPDRRARSGRAARAGARRPREGRDQGPRGGAAPGRPPDRAAPRGRAGQGGPDLRAADSPPGDAERRDAPRTGWGPGGGPRGGPGARPRRDPPPAPARDCRQSR